MTKHKEKKAEETSKQELTAPPAATAAKPESVVDEVFDVVTAWAAQGLGAAKRGLEASARWLDDRAKVVGELATKLASTSRASKASSGAAEGAASAQSA